jgi:ribonuclease HI
VRNGITEWLPRWKRNGWLTAGKQPVKNDGAAIDNAKIFDDKLREWRTTTTWRAR